jgi:hypothetical protein
MKDIIIKNYQLADCLGLEALKTIATKEDCKVIDKLIADSWKVCDGIYNDDEEIYHQQKREIFIKYGFRFDDGGEITQ